MLLHVVDTASTRISGSARHINTGRDFKIWTMTCRTTRSLKTWSQGRMLLRNTFPQYVDSFFDKRVLDITSEHIPHSSQSCRNFSCSYTAYWPRTIQYAPVGFRGMNLSCNSILPRDELLSNSVAHYVSMVRAVC
jgi:hypothetical protein